MDIRKLPVSQGLAWFRQAIDLGGRNPKGVFGAAALMILAFYAVALILVVPMVASVSGLDKNTADAGALMARIMPIAAAMMLAISLLVPFLVGGLMHVIRETEAGRKPGPLALFQPFRSGRGGRLLAIGLIVLAVQFAGGVLAMLAGGSDYIREYMEMMRGIMSGADPRTIAQPKTPFVMLLLQLVVNYVAYAILLFGVPLVLFFDSALGAALRDSLKASGRNVGPNVFAGLLLLVGIIVAVLLFFLFAALVTMLAKLVHDALATIVMLGLFLLFGCALIVVIVGAGYFAWRDTFDAAAPTPASTLPASGIEV